MLITLVLHSYVTGDVWRPKAIQDKLMLIHLIGKDHFDDNDRSKCYFTLMAQIHNIGVIYA